MNNLERMNNIKRMQAQVDAFVPDQPLPDLIYPQSMTDGIYNARNEASYKVDEATGEVFKPNAIAQTGNAVVVADSAPIVETLDDVIARLSALRPALYSQVRKDEAKKLGVSPSALDSEVRMKQKEKDNASDAPFKEVEPWPHAVDGIELLNSVTNTIHKYVICNKHTARSAALWVAHTYLLDVIHCSPLAIITAPDKGCGKSTLLDVLADMVYQPIPTASISSAALYRTIEEYHPTLLIDEVDSFLAGNEEMRGIINCGHKRKAAFVMRCDGDDNKPKRFSTWAAKLLSGISAKNLHPTITSRAIILELRKKLPTETIASNRNNQAEYHAISRKLVRWATDIKAQVVESATALPNSLDDRQKDNWEPLLTIADIAGGQWSELARETAEAICHKVESKSVKTELLEDIKSVFETRKVDRISIPDLITDLCVDDEAPWVTWNKGKSITGRGINHLLGDYGIVIKSVRFSGYEVSRGLEKSQFKDAWDRYLNNLLPDPPKKGVTNVTPLQTNGYKAPLLQIDDSQSVTKQTQSVTNTPCNVTKNQSITSEAIQHKACNGMTPKIGEGQENLYSESRSPLETPDSEVL